MSEAYAEEKPLIPPGGSKVQAADGRVAFSLDGTRESCFCCKFSDGKFDHGADDVFTGAFSLDELDEIFDDLNATWNAPWRTVKMIHFGAFFFTIVLVVVGGIITLGIITGSVDAETGKVGGGATKARVNIFSAFGAAGPGLAVAFALVMMVILPMMFPLRRYLTGRARPEAIALLMDKCKALSLQTDYGAMLIEDDDSGDEEGGGSGGGPQKNKPRRPLYWAIVPQEDVQVSSCVQLGGEQYHYDERPKLVVSQVELPAAERMRRPQVTFRAPEVEDDDEEEPTIE